jgi:hypothetical protein
VNRIAVIVFVKTLPMKISFFLQRPIVKFSLEGIGSFSQGIRKYFFYFKKRLLSHEIAIFHFSLNFVQKLAGVQVIFIALAK